MDWKISAILIGAAGVGAWLGTRKAKAAAPLDTRGANANLSWWTDDDFRQFAAMAQRLKMNPADLLIVLYSESSLQPWARNPRDTSKPAIAIGLNQIIRSTAHGLGLSDAQWQAMLTMSVHQQLPIVERYFRSLAWVAKGHGFDSAAQVYEANFAPGYLFKGSDPGTILYTKGKDGASYELNKGFDSAGKGYITLGDLGSWVARRAHDGMFLTALQRLRIATGNPTLTPRFA